MLYSHQQLNETKLLLKLNYSFLNYQKLTHLLNYLQFVSVLICQFLKKKKNYQDNIEFILTATIYKNKNKVINDNLYEYDELAVPFLAKLSRAIYNELVD